MQKPKVDSAGYKILRLMIRSIGTIPFGVLYVLSDVLYFLMYHVVGYRKKVTRKNLTECFPEKSIKEIKGIERRFYRNFCDNMLETCKMGSLSGKEMSRRMKFTNIGEINEVLRSGRSVALYLGHFCNWEWISSMPLHLEKGAVAAQIYHELSNEAFNRVILENRAAHGATNVEMNQTARFIMEMRREKQECIIGFIADQSPKWKDVHYFLPFFHHTTPVIVGTEKIAKHFGFDVWFVKVRKVKRGYYEAEFVRMDSNAKRLPDFELTDMYYSMLEDMIRKNPEWYLWTHNRFKYSKETLESAN